METQKTVLLGNNLFPYRFPDPLPNATDDERLKYFSSKTNPNGRLLLELIQYLTEYTQYFDKVNAVIIYEQNRLDSNGAFGGLVNKNKSFRN